MLSDEYKSSVVLERVKLPVKGEEKTMRRVIEFVFYLVLMVDDFYGVFPRFLVFSLPSWSNMVVRPSRVHGEVDEWIATNHTATRFTRWCSIYA